MKSHRLQAIALTIFILSCVTAGTEATLGSGDYILHVVVDGWPYEGFSTSASYNLEIDVTATSANGLVTSASSASTQTAESDYYADFDTSTGKLDYVFLGMYGDTNYSININSSQTNYPNYFSCTAESSPNTFPIEDTADSTCDTKVCYEYISCGYSPEGTVSGLADGETVGLTVTKNNSVTIDLVDSEDITLDSSALENGTFKLNANLTKYETYNVTIASQPDQSHCTVSNGSDEIDNDDDGAATIGAISVVCAKQYIFESTGTFTGEEISPSEADTICQNDALLPDGYTAKAMIVDGTTRAACTTANCSGGASENIDWVLYPETSYFQLGSDTLLDTTNSAGIFEFPLSHQISESGFLTWTGLNTNWTSNTTSNCTNWTSSSGGISGTHGDNAATNDTAINSGTLTCDQLLKIYCVTQ